MTKVKLLAYLAALMLVGYVARKISGFAPEPYRWAFMPAALILGAVGFHYGNAKRRPTTLGLNRRN